MDELIERATAAQLRKLCRWLWRGLLYVMPTNQRPEDWLARARKEAGL